MELQFTYKNKNYEFDIDSNRMIKLIGAWYDIGESVASDMYEVIDDNKFENVVDEKFAYDLFAAELEEFAEDRYNEDLEEIKDDLKFDLKYDDFDNLDDWFSRVNELYKFGNPEEVKSILKTVIEDYQENKNLDDSAVHYFIVRTISGSKQLDHIFRDEERESAEKAYQDKISTWNFDKVILLDNDENVIKEWNRDDQEVDDEDLPYWFN